MRKLYSGQDPAFTQYLKQRLEAAGIGCVLRNSFLGGAVGDLPVTETWPEIWILSAADWVRARSMLAELSEEPEASLQDWTCPRCGERVEASLAVCWNCGAPAPEGEPPSA